MRRLLIRQWMIIIIWWMQIIRVIFLEIVLTIIWDRFNYLIEMCYLILSIQTTITRSTIMNGNNLSMKHFKYCITKRNPGHKNKITSQILQIIPKQPLSQIQLVIRTLPASFINLPYTTMHNEKNNYKNYILKKKKK